MPKKSKEKLKGGVADGESPTNFDQKQLLIGIDVELEHTNDIMTAMEIAMDHLKEDPRYYCKLAKIEKPQLENLYKEAGNSQSKEKRSENRLDVINKHFELLKKNKILTNPNPPALGTGSYGTAFDIGGGKVLKITKDGTEAVASFKLIGKKTKYIVNVFNVFRFPKEGFVGDEIFGIVLEKLSPMSAGEIAEFERAEKIIKKYTERDLYSVYGKTWEEWTGWVYDKLDRLDVDEDERSAVEEAVEDLEAFKLDEILEELSNNGISFGDFHSGNLMKRGREYVITDLGQSRTTGGKNPPMLEKNHNLPFKTQKRM